MKIRSDLNVPEVREALEEWAGGTTAWLEAGLGQVSKMSVPNAYVSKLLRVIREPEPMQPPIPWKYIDKRYRWMAMDSDGVWWAYVCLPRLRDFSIRWIAPFSASRQIPCPPGADRPWTETLIERPEDE